MQHAASQRKAEILRGRGNLFKYFIFYLYKCVALFFVVISVFSRRGAVRDVLGALQGELRARGRGGGAEPGCAELRGAARGRNLRPLPLSRGGGRGELPPEEPQQGNNAENTAFSRKGSEKDKAKEARETETGSLLTR